MRYCHDIFGEDPGILGCRSAIRTGGQHLTIHPQHLG
jgi:hypothetical protein